MKFLICLMITIIVCLSAVSADTAIRIEAESIPGMESLDVADASGGKVGRIPSTMTAWGWTTIGLGRELSPGSYKVTFRLRGTPEQTARTLFYWQKDDSHQPDNGFALPAYTDSAFHDHTLTFNADTAFRNVIIKIGEAAGVPGIAIAWLEIESAPAIEPYRITAYRRALSFPYPDGISTTTMKTELEAPPKLPGLVEISIAISLGLSNG